MACARCEDLCVRYAIRHPRELRKAIQIAAENIVDKTLVEVIPDRPSIATRRHQQLAANGHTRPFDRTPELSMILV